MTISQKKRLDIPQLPFTLFSFRRFDGFQADVVKKTAGIEYPGNTIVVTDISDSEKEASIKLDRSRYLSYLLNSELEQYRILLHERISPNDADTITKLTEILKDLDRLIDRCGIENTGRSSLGPIFSKPDFMSNLKSADRSGTVQSSKAPTLVRFYHQRIVDYRTAVTETLRVRKTKAKNGVANQGGGNPRAKLTRSLGTIYLTIFERMPGVSISNEQHKRQRDNAGPFPRFVSAVLSHAFGADKSDWPFSSVEDAIRSAGLRSVEPISDRVYHSLLDKEWLSKKANGN